ncbi:type II toxin-antitoxin system RatA family toxin [Roseospirillum parvum]|uniref:Coenzyme Q-binding protein COQ10 n=1 Tax=Roseospirillum parvum TaxID=83401 RepID=A0A1G7YFM4_9PROT|nr:type II toxin-antitoxin system RatA family toxin [Roseospirillum parvum]SDG95328.1 coenzyme Q-binding protein COQ10 [Roseospirillum parvum]
MPTHAEKRIVPYTQKQLFDLVADVERYPDFLPWCLGSRIKRRLSDTVFEADLVVGFKMIRERFTSRVELIGTDKVNVTYKEGPFRYLNNHWVFIEQENGTCIDFYVDFEFRSKMLQKLMGTLFNEAVQRMVAAFEQRARQLYGPSGLSSAG